MVAAERGFYNIVKKMIERKVDINQRDNQGATGKGNKRKDNYYYYY